MVNEDILPNELIEIATSLEKQFRVLRVPSRKIPLAEWDCQSLEFRKVIPQWLITLLANHSLVRPFLDLGEGFSDFGEVFSFWPPAAYSKNFSDSMIDDHIVKAGFVPLSDTSDGSGNLWLTSITGDASSPIYLFGLSSCEIKLVGGNLTRLLTSCTVDGKNWRNH